MRTIYRSKATTLKSLPEGVQVVYLQDLFIALAAGFAVAFLGFSYLGTRLSALGGFGIESWSRNTLVVFVYVAAGVGVVGAIFFQKWFVKPQPALEQTRGARLYEDKFVGGEGFEAMKRVFDEQLAVVPGFNPPVALATPSSKFDYLNLPSKASQCVQLPDDVSRKHILIVGQTGAGKSIVVSPIMMQAYRQGAKLLITDTKAEYIVLFPPEDVVIFGVHDARQSAWDMAVDVRTVPDFMNLMSILVQVNDKDPHWGNSAITLGVAWLTCLQTTKPGRWTPSEFVSVGSRPVEELREAFKVTSPDAYNLIKDDTNGAASILSTLNTSLAGLKFVVDEWEKRNYPTFSFREFLSNPSPTRKVVVFLSGGDNSAINMPLIRTALTFAGRAMDSSSFTNDTAERPRNIWVFCDEFQAFGRLSAFINPVLERGRSRGIHAVVACQDVAQLEEIYGQQTVQFWLANFGMRILAGAGFGHTASTFSKDVGQKSFLKTHVSKTMQIDSSNTTVNEQEHQAEVLTVDEVVSKTGFDKKSKTGSALYLLGSSSDVFILKQSPKPYPALASAYVPALWIEEAEVLVRSARAPAFHSAELNVASPKMIPPIASNGASIARPRMLDEELPDELDDVPEDYEANIDKETEAFEEALIQEGQTAVQQLIPQGKTDNPAVETEFSVVDSRFISIKVDILKEIQYAEHRSTTGKNLTIARNQILLLRRNRI